MKYLNTKSEFLKESSVIDIATTKDILRNGLIKVATNSHLVSDQITDNIEKFLSTLNIGLLTEHVGNITGLLGTGVFGAVFQLNNNKVLKLTFDYREAPFLYEYSLKNRTKGIVKVDKIFKIKFGNTYAYLIIRDKLDFIKDYKVIQSVISDLKINGINENIIKKYRDGSKIEYKIFLALKSMYDIDHNWRGTHSENIAIQNVNVVLYDGFSKNIKLSDSDITLLNLESIDEAMINKRSLDQLKKIRKMTKGIDIGDRVSKQSFPNQIKFGSSIDKVQTYDEYMKEPFKINQNIKNFKVKKLRKSKMKFLKLFLEYNKEIITTAGRWRIKQKSTPDNIDLNDDESNIKINKKYTFLGITFTPKYINSNGKYYSSIQKENLKNGNEVYPSWVIYSESIDELKHNIRFKIKEYLEEMENGTLNDSVKFKNVNSYKLFLEYNEYTQSKIDLILDKISKNGIDSLTTEEKAFLDAQKSGDKISDDALNKLEQKDKEFSITSTNKKFKFDYKYSEDLTIEEGGILHHGIMHLPNITSGDGREISGDIKGYVLEGVLGIIGTNFEKQGYTDFDFTEGVEYEYDDFILEIINYIKKKK